MGIKISLIVAAAENDVIGDDETLLWHIPEDFRYFKATTMGKPIVMGRKTFDSIGKPLPKRRNIVVTRQDDWAFEGVETAKSVEDAIKMAENGGAEEVMIIGGGQIYAQALPIATCVYLTRIHNVYNGRTLFPSLDTSVWQEVARQKGSECETVGIDYDFIVYERKNDA